MNKQIAIIMLILGIMFLGLAAADTTRSCQAQYVVGVRSIDDAEGLTYPSFSGQGTMDYYAPNSARRKAYENLQECIQAFDHRDREVSYCSEANQIYSYPFADGLIPQIRHDLCSRYPGHDNIMIDLHVLFQGDEGCVPGLKTGTILARLKRCSVRRQPEDKGEMKCLDRPRKLN
ncbi:MAG: hypothetical protein MUO26_00005 [Methanotrichaceae archaeon]|nr:hypothetical protein [Methanotrichaceae archaeon]